METVTIPKEEYKQLKEQAEMDMELVKDILNSLKDIKEGRVVRVK